MCLLTILRSNVCIQPFIVHSLHLQNIYTNCQNLSGPVTSLYKRKYSSFVSSSPLQSLCLVTFIMHFTYILRLTVHKFLTIKSLRSFFSLSFSALMNYAISQPLISCRRINHIGIILSTSSKPRP